MCVIKRRVLFVRVTQRKSFTEKCRNHVLTPCFLIIRLCKVLSL